jgi:type II secretory pathway component PulF
MPEYSYQGVDRGGKRVQGKVNAPNEGELRMILRGQGIRPVRIAKLSALQSDLGSLIKGSQASISLQTLVVFTRQLQVLISSGIPIVQGLEILAEQSTDKNMKGIMAAIKEKVSGGAYFWEALSSYPKACPTLYVSLIKAGETSGAIDQMLKRLSRYLEDSDRLRKLLKGAMMYPIIVVTIGHRRDDDLRDSEVRGAFAKLGTRASRTDSVRDRSLELHGEQHCLSDVRHRCRDLPHPEVRSVARG